MRFLTDCNHTHLEAIIQRHSTTGTEADFFQRFPVMPIVTIDDASHADRLASALVGGGIACAEVTLRTEAGLEAIARLAGRDDIVVGAGTVLSSDDVDRAADAGASFVVSPGFGLDVVTRAQERGIPVVPGVMTPSDVQAAVLLGVDRLKLFPAAAAGGLALLDAFSGPFPAVRFMVSGGVAPDNLASYLAHPMVFSAGSSWIATRASIAAGRFEDIRNLAAAASRLACADPTAVAVNRAGTV